MTATSSMLESSMHRLVQQLKQRRSIADMPIQYLGVGLLFLLGMVVRVALFHIVTGDYTTFLSPWYDFIKAHGGFAAMKYTFSNYNPPYLYLLAIATYVPIPKLIAIKSISVIFDTVLALFAYLILRLQYRQSLLPSVGALMVFFAPTVVINSSAWGQCDAIYAAFCLGSLYFLLKQRWSWACVFFGLAIAFKLQAIFFAPVLLLVALRRALPLRYLLLIPAVFLLLLAPAFVAGRDATSLLTIYASQASTGGVGGGMGQFRAEQGAPSGQPPSGSGNQAFRSANGFGGGRSSGLGSGNSFAALTYNAPTIYQWFTGTSLANNKWVGIVLAALAVASVGLLLLMRKTPLTAMVIIQISLVCVLTIPFFLPEMHERYFYLADVLSILCAFAFPLMFPIAIIMQGASLLSYAPYLFNIQSINLGYVSCGVLAITLLAWVMLVKSCQKSVANAV